jgi:hypothetical protein
MGSIGMDETGDTRFVARSQFSGRRQLRGHLLAALDRARYRSAVGGVLRGPEYRRAGDGMVNFFVLGPGLPREPGTLGDFYANVAARVTFYNPVRLPSFRAKRGIRFCLAKKQIPRADQGHRPSE